MSGVIYCGDNLEVLREYIPDQSVDLVYLDPPFNSQRTFNMVYKDSQALAKSFKDHWSWDEAAPTFSQLMQASEIPKRLVTMLSALHDMLVEDDSDLLAYLVMMAPRLNALHRVLKPTGSLYLHCDSAASHYLKTMLDAIFGHSRFQNEIVWKRTTSHSDAKRWSPVSDSLLFYSKGDTFTWNKVHVAHDEKYLQSKYRHADSDGRRYMLDNMTSPNPRPNMMYEWKGHASPVMGWRYSRETMAKLDGEGRIWYPDSKQKRPRIKKYLDEMSGVVPSNIWTDIDPINSQAAERLGYPTQKPLKLLERILAASSNPGDLVLDPFCGCGTTVEAAQVAGRRWIGIDIARQAVDVIGKRFERADLAAPNITYHPADEQGAAALAKQDKALFEQWVLRKVRAARVRKRDRGIDGETMYRVPGGKSYHVIFEVKGGLNVQPHFMRGLRGVLEREKAAVCVLISLKEPTKEMRHEATMAGFLDAKDNDGPIPRLQIVTVKQLFADNSAVRVPGENQTGAPKRSLPPPVDDTQLALQLEREPGSANDNGAGKSKRPSLPGGPRKTQPASTASKGKTKSAPPAKRRSSR